MVPLCMFVGNDAKIIVHAGESISKGQDNSTDGPASSLQTTIGKYNYYTIITITDRYLYYRFCSNPWKIINDEDG